jgi:hypothetical protein
MYLFLDYQNTLRIVQFKVNKAMKKKYPNSLSSRGGMILYNDYNDLFWRLSLSYALKTIFFNLENTPP